MVSGVRINKGFSLIELMIALVIGLLVLLGAYQLFIVGKKSFDQVTSLSDRQQSLSYFIDTFSFSVRNASSINIASANDLKLDYLNRESSLYCPDDSSFWFKFTEAAADEFSAINLRVHCDTDDNQAHDILTNIQPGSLGFDFLPANLGVIIRFTLVDEADLLDDEEIEFFVVNRAAASKGIKF